MNDAARFDPHAVKILADLLALTLGENDPQAEAAIAAIRRRAASDGITGGAVKALLHRLVDEMPDAASPSSLVVVQEREAEADVAHLRWTIDEQSRELHETRHARHLAESALTEIRAANMSLAERGGRLNRGRHTAWILGVLLGAGCAAAGYGAYRWARAAHVEAVPPPPPHTRLTEALHSCFLSSSNSLGGGEPYDLHLLLDVDAAGRITAGKVAPDQSAVLEDAEHANYARLVLRTITSGSCGALPMPASLKGKAGQLDLILPR